MTQNPTNKPVHGHIPAHPPNISRTRERNDIVGRTSLPLPSLSGLEQTPLTASLEKQKTDQHQTVPARPLKTSTFLPAFPFSKKRSADKTIPVMKRIRLRTFLPLLLLCLLLPGAVVYLSPLIRSQTNHSTLVNKPLPHDQPGTTAGSAIRSFSVGTSPSLMIKNFSGNVSISGASTDTLIIKANDKGKSLASGLDSRAIQWTQSRDKQGHDFISVVTQPAYRDINYDVRVPSSTRVNVEAISGSISIYGIDGVSITLSNGNITIEKVNGPVKALIENGDVALRSVKGQIALTASSGSIQANNIKGQVKAVTQHGDVTLHQAMLSGQSLVKTTDGSLHFTGTLNATGTYILETLHGNIDLTLPADAIFQLRTRIGSGSISNEFGNNHSAPTSRPLILVNIGNGSVTIKRGV